MADRFDEQAAAIFPDPPPAGPSIGALVAAHYAGQVMRDRIAAALRAAHAEGAASRAEEIVAARAEGRAEGIEAAANLFDQRATEHAKCADSFRWLTGGMPSVYDELADEARAQARAIRYLLPTPPAASAEPGDAGATCTATFGFKACVREPHSDGRHVSRSGSSWTDAPKPRCACQWEQGDSLCPAHPRCEECGEETCEHQAANTPGDAVGTVSNPEPTPTRSAAEERWGRGALQHHDHPCEECDGSGRDGDGDSCIDCGSTGVRRWGSYYADAGTEECHECKRTTACHHFDGDDGGFCECVTCYVKAHAATGCREWQRAETDLGIDAQGDTKREEQRR